VDEALEPLLARGAVVLLDRFVDSSLAYQGAGRELGIERVREVNEFATAGLAPDLTLLLTVEPSVGRDRSGERSATPDRLEREPDEFFRRIADAYRQLAQAHPERITTIDATQPRDAVLAAALRAVETLV
jgi:dTMP kinase